MATVKGVDKLKAQLAAHDKARGTDNDPTPVGTVGYTAAYAVHVHENLEAAHPNGQAKFLEQPLRELRHVLEGLITQALKGGSTLSQAILIACLRLQRESQLLVPVETGNLKNSAFTRMT